MFVIEKKKTKEFEDFVNEMDSLGWMVTIYKERSVIVERKGYMRKSGKPVRYSCNRLANDYDNPLITSQLIMQNCGMENYKKYAPRSSPIAAKIQQQSEDLAKKLAQIAHQEQQVIQKPNKMVADLSTQKSQILEKKYESLSW